MPLEEVQKQVLALIEEHGWCHIDLHPRPGQPACSYTIGLMERFKHAEVLLFGRNVELVQSFLLDIVEAIGKGRSFEREGVYADVLGGYACAFKPVTASHHEGYAEYAHWYRKHLALDGTLRVVQCLWPDRYGRYPWDPGCDPAVVDSQPRLDKK